MLIILPIMLCCTAQKFTYYALINAQYLPIMLNYAQCSCLSSYALLLVYFLFIYFFIYLNFMVENYQGSAGYLYQQPNKTYVHTYTLIKLIS